MLHSLVRLTCRMMMACIILSATMATAQDYASDLDEMDAMESTLPPYHPEMTEGERAKAQVLDGWLVMPMEDVQFT
jgi:hypothetical protein